MDYSIQERIKYPENKIKGIIQQSAYMFLEDKGSMGLHLQEEEYSTDHADPLGVCCDI